MTTVCEKQDAIQDVFIREVIVQDPKTEMVSRLQEMAGIIREYCYANEDRDALQLLRLGRRMERLAHWIGR